MTTEGRLTLNLKFSSYSLQSAVSIVIRTIKHISKGSSILVNKLRECLRCSRKEPNLSRLPTGRRETADVNSHMPCYAHAVHVPRPCRAVPWPSEVAFRSAWSEYGRGAAWARHDKCELACNIQECSPPWFRWIH